MFVFGQKIFLKCNFFGLKARFTKLEFDTEDQVLLMLKNILDSHGTVSNSFGSYLTDLLLKIWEIYEKCSNSVNFWARKMFFFLNGSEFRQKLIGTIISVLVRHLRV